MQLSAQRGQSTVARKEPPNLAKPTKGADHELGNGREECVRTAEPEANFLIAIEEAIVKKIRVHLGCMRR